MQLPKIDWPAANSHNLVHPISSARRRCYWSAVYSHAQTWAHRKIYFIIEKMFSWASFCSCIYLWSIVLTAPITQSRILSKCIKIFFQMPSSNSCMKSTRNMQNMSNPRWDSCSKNALCENKYKLSTIEKKKLKTTSVGTREYALRKSSTSLLLTIQFFK